MKQPPKAIGDVWDQALARYCDRRRAMRCSAPATTWADVPHHHVATFDTGFGPVTILRTGTDGGLAVGVTPAGLVHRVALTCEASDVREATQDDLPAWYPTEDDLPGLATYAREYPGTFVDSAQAQLSAPLESRTYLNNPHAKSCAACMRIQKPGETHCPECGRGEYL